MCNVLARWWHRRQRNIDRDYLVPSIYKVVRGSGYVHTFNEMWDTYKATPAAAHWRCACGREKAAHGYE